MFSKIRFGFCLEQNKNRKSTSVLSKEEASLKSIFYSTLKKSFNIKKNIIKVNYLFIQALSSDRANK